MRAIPVIGVLLYVIGCSSGSDGDGAGSSSSGGGVAGTSGAGASAGSGGSSAGAAGTAGVGGVAGAGGLAGAGGSAGAGGGAGAGGVAGAAGSGGGGTWLQGPVVFAGETKGLKTPFPGVEVSSLVVDPVNPGVFWVAPDSGPTNDWVGAFDLKGNKLVQRPLKGHSNPNADLEDGFSGPSPQGPAIHFAESQPGGSAGKILRFPVPPVVAGQSTDTSSLTPDYIKYSLSGGGAGGNQDTEAWAMDPFTGTAYKINKWGGSSSQTVHKAVFRCVGFDKLKDGDTANFVYMGKLIHGFSNLADAGSNKGVLTRGAFSHSHGDAGGSYLFMVGNYHELMVWIRSPDKTWEQVWTSQPVAPYVFAQQGGGSEAADFALDGMAIYSHSEGADFRRIDIKSLGVAP